MKKSLYAILFALVCFGCMNTEQKEAQAKRNFNENPIVVLYSCEYLTWMGYGGLTNYTHKGNCKFCIARNNNSVCNCNQK